jgi:uncharacterized membrane protein
MEPEVSKREVIKDGYGLVLWLSIGGLLASLVVSVYCYRKVFGAQLSTDPNYWSAFGTYFGGIFSPLVSFVTLVAILKTIKLQSTLLETQNTEFSVMQDIQMRTLASQQELSERALKDSARQELEACRLSFLSLVDRYLDHAHKRLASLTSRLDTLAEWMLDGKATDRKDDFIKVSEILDSLKAHINELHVIIVDITFSEICDPELMRMHFRSELGKLFEKHPHI